jgi:hypothetical protein
MDDVCCHGLLLYTDMMCAATACYCILTWCVLPRPATVYWHDVCCHGLLLCTDMMCAVTACYCILTWCVLPRSATVYWHDVCCHGLLLYTDNNTNRDFAAHTKYWRGKQNIVNCSRC